MKNPALIPAIILVTSSLCLKAQNDQPKLNQVELMPITCDLIGTYEYYGNQKGISIWNEKNFSWSLEVIPDFDTQEDRINSVNVAGGTWMIQDSIVTCTYQYHTDPKMVGTSFRFIYTINGNIINSRFINKEGNVIGRSSAIKIK